METNRPEVVGVVEGVGSSGGEREEVVEGELLRGGEVLDRRVLVVGTAEIHVPRRACGRVEAEVEREGALQDPAVRRHRDEATEEQLEGDALPEARDARARSSSTSVFSLSSSACRNAAAVAYLIVPEQRARTRVFRWRSASCSSCRRVRRPGPALARGHRCLFRLEVVGDVHECSRRRSDWHGLSPDGADLLVVGMGVDDDAGGRRSPRCRRGTSRWTLSGILSLSSAVKARSRARRRLLHPDGHPLLPDVVVLGAREASDAIEPPPHPLEASLLDMMGQKLATDAFLSRLLAGEVAALLIGVGLQAADVRRDSVMHRSSIALPLRT